MINISYMQVKTGYNFFNILKLNLALSNTQIMTDVTDAVHAQ